MSNLKNKLNKTATTNAEFEEVASNIVKEVQINLYDASASVLKAHELLNKHGDFVKYLDSKQYNGNEISDKISRLYDEVDELQQLLKEAADKAEY